MIFSEYKKKAQSLGYKDRNKQRNDGQHETEIQKEQTNHNTEQTQNRTKERTNRNKYILKETIHTDIQMK